MTMTTNEELVAAVQAGDHDALLKLWEQVRRLVLKQAHKWVGAGGLEVDDLMQCGFIAVMEAVDSYDGSAAFTTWLMLCLRREFAAACFQRTERQRREPLLNALSIDAPLTDDTGAPFTLADILEDPTAAVAMEAVDEQDHDDRLRAVLEEAIAGLMPEQQEAVRRRYYWREPPQPPGPERLRDNAAHDAALKRLRHPSVSKRLRAAME